MIQWDVERRARRPSQGISDKKSHSVMFELMCNSYKIYEKHIDFI